MTSERLQLPIDLPSFAVLDESPYPQAAYGLDFHVWAVNRLHCEMTGVAPEDVVGRDLFDAFPGNPEDPGSDGELEMAASLKRMVRARIPDTMDAIKHDVRREDGTYAERYWQITHSPIWSNGDGTGEIIGALQTTREVTAEIARQKINEAQQRSAMIGGQLMFFQLDLRSDHVTSSAELQELFGYEPAPGGIGLEAFFDRIHEDDRASVAEVVDEARGAPMHTQYRIDYRIERPDGTMRWLSARMEVVRDGEDRAPQLTGVILDVTDLLRSEAHLRGALKDRDLLIAEVHHRVKNSLQLVTSVLNLEAAGAAGTDAAGRLRSAAARVQAIATVHGVLYQSKDVRRVDLGAFVQTLIDHVAASAGAAAMGIAIDVVLPLDDMHVATDRAISLSLIVNELVTNALKHAFPDGRAGTIVVTLERTEDGDIAVTVADDGIGNSGTARSPAALGGETRTGLGSKLITSLARQIEARLSHDDDTPGFEQGYSMRLDFPA